MYISQIIKNLEAVSDKLDKILEEGIVQVNPKIMWHIGEAFRNVEITTTLLTEIKNGTYNYNKDMSHFLVD